MTQQPHYGDWLVPQDTSAVTGGQPLAAALNKQRKTTLTRLGDSVHGAETLGAAETQTDSRKLCGEVRAQLLTISTLPPPECFQEDGG